MSQSRIKFDNYDGFVEKFKPKKTTDDCYTPPEIYAVVLDYVRERWGVEDSNVVRPFWPGGDFEAFEYPDGCVVVDNPPFSILARIQEFYLDRGTMFFLFAPSLMCLSGRRCMEVDHIVCDCNVTYENGAVVRTGFVTNLDEENVLESDPELGRRLNEANNERLKETKKTVPKYEYPDDVITAAKAQWLAAHGTKFSVRRSDACKISALDQQREKGKTIFGSGLLLSKKAAAEKAAAEKAAAEKAAAEKAAAEKADVERWHLSERELEIQRMLGNEA